MAVRQRITIFGGSGFIGRHLVRRVAAEGYIVRVAVRDSRAAAFLKSMGEPGQIVIRRADSHGPATDGSSGCWERRSR
ncbi:Oxidoreductase [invertebrate metagenome]|uniref:Oxidoreductase n=1 Tax=invertebrate metagenome TaxID=1711999 RepID=A0A484H5R9_9ZZZZ